MGKASITSITNLFQDQLLLQSGNLLPQFFVFGLQLAGFGLGQVETVLNTPRADSTAKLTDMGTSPALKCESSLAQIGEYRVAAHHHFHMAKCPYHKVWALPCVTSIHSIHTVVCDSRQSTGIDFDPKFGQGRDARVCNMKNELASFTGT